MSAVDLSSDYFTLFRLPMSFDIDGERLAERYRELQRAVHPDRYANAAPAERRLSVQWASHVNEAYRTLKDPLARARYLLTLKGVVIDDNSTIADNHFLLEQMSLREQLEAASTAQDFQDMGKLISAQMNAQRLELTTLFSRGAAADLAAAVEITRKFQFFRRLEDEIAEREESIL